MYLLGHWFVLDFVWCLPWIVKIAGCIFAFAYRNSFLLSYLLGWNYPQSHLWCFTCCSAELSASRMYCHTCSGIRCKIDPFGRPLTWWPDVLVSEKTWSAYKIFFNFVSGGRSYKASVRNQPNSCGSEYEHFIRSIYILSQSIIFLTLK